MAKALEGFAEIVCKNSHSDALTVLQGPSHELVKTDKSSSCGRVLKISELHHFERMLKLVLEARVQNEFFTHFGKGREERELGEAATCSTVATLGPVQWGCASSTREIHEYESRRWLCEPTVQRGQMSLSYTWLLVYYRIQQPFAWLKSWGSTEDTGRGDDRRPVWNIVDGINIMEVERIQEVSDIRTIKVTSKEQLKLRIF